VKDNLALILIVVVFSLSLAFFNAGRMAKVRLIELQQKVQEMEEHLLDRQELIDEIKALRQENRELYNRMSDWLNEWDVQEKEVTGYAPLDCWAKEGMCYAGNPSITASGQQVVIGRTIAAGPDVPFGTKVWIKGIGFRVVQDRGGRIGNEHIDVAVATQEEAFRGVGRAKSVVVIQRY